MEPANEIRSQGCKSSTGFMEGFTEQSAAVIPFLSRRRRVPHRWSSRLVLLCSAVFFCSRRAKTSALLCLSFYPAHTLLYFDLIPCLIIREQRAQNNKSLFNGNKFRNFCGNKLKSSMGKVSGSIRSTNYAVIGNEERLHVTWKEGHCQKLA
ncbi:hypothetical protein Ahy_A03g012544 isoform A [Arachis hypogaea]|uniref:Uncharacterized protein n=1 Tax=Arachis hypogaea TaxID=3818 RepID=A0A445DTU6_ARAHY|nr:hypothetical protein Ahy_A03g012544 isoform A [Arachis hypogaea]